MKINQTNQSKYKESYKVPSVFRYINNITNSTYIVAADFNQSSQLTVTASSTCKCVWQSNVYCSSKGCKIQLYDNFHQNVDENINTLQQVGTLQGAINVKTYEAP